MKNTYKELLRAYEEQVSLLKDAVNIRDRYISDLHVLLNSIAEEVVSEDLDNNPAFVAEVLCRKLYKFGFVTINEDLKYRANPKRWEHALKESLNGS